MELEEILKNRKKKTAERRQEGYKLARSFGFSAQESTILSQRKKEKIREFYEAYKSKKNACDVTNEHNE